MSTLKQLIECEISDFFAGFGHPGEPETPEEMQSQLLARVMPLFAGLEQEPIILYRERNPYNGMSTGWIELTPDEYDFVKDNASDNADFKTVYAAPQLPQPAVPECYQRLLHHAHGMAMGRDWNKGTMAEHHREKLCKAVEDCRASMLQGAEPPAYEIKRFGEFGANGLTRDDGELAISIQFFHFERGTTPQPVRGGGIVEKYALQAIINALQQQCDRLSDAPIPVIWPAVPQQD